MNANGTALGGPVAIVGGGVMGRALCEGLLASGSSLPGSVTVAEPDPDRRVAIEQELGVHVADTALGAAAGADVVVLAVKPQAFPRVAPELCGRLAPTALVVSIMAGITTTAMMEALGHANIVRAIPNTAARLRQAVSVWYPTATVSPAQRQVASTVLSAIGETIEVADEGLIDPATAVSGSGPAYICLVAEAMTEGAVAVGFSREAARRLVSATLSGTAALLAQPGAHPALVREGVTSPAGTTAAGLQALEARAVRAAFVEAVQAALRRSRELGSPR
ncbi:MAG: pyrroline-5-carboxylate reductase [Anaerolineae bacterium]